MKNLLDRGRGFDRPRQTHFSAGAMHGLIERELQSGRKQYGRGRGYGWLEGVRRTGIMAATTARDPRIAAAMVLIVAFALIAALSLGSQSTSAGVGPKGVRGYVWDSLRNPVPNANVTVKMYNGAVLMATQYYDATEPNGFYTVTFGDSQWNPGWTIQLTAGYEIYSIVNSTVAVDGAPYQWLNATLGFTIPEFGSGLTAGLTIASSMAMVIAMLAIRRRGK